MKGHKNGQTTDNEHTRINPIRSNAAAEGETAETARSSQAVGDQRTAGEAAVSSVQGRRGQGAGEPAARQSEQSSDRARDGAKSHRSAL